MATADPISTKSRCRALMRAGVLLVQPFVRNFPPRALPSANIGQLAVPRIDDQQRMAQPFVRSHAVHY